VEQYEAFLSEETTAPEEARQLAQSRLETMLHTIARIDLKCAESGAVLSLDGKSIGKSPLTLSLRVNPGPHQLVAERTGRLPYLKRLVLEHDETATINVQLKSAEKPLHKRWQFWVGMVGAAAVASTAIALAVTYGQARDPMPALGETSISIGKNP
jgi:hypothetical protein